MLQIIELKEKNIVATKASGKLRKEDIEKIHPLIHAILDKGMKVRWFMGRPENGHSPRHGL